MLLGVHVSAAGKIYEALERARKLGCNTMQIFSRNPQQWRDKQLDKADIAEFVRRKAAYKIEPVFVHIPYLINLASPNLRLYKASIAAYIQDMEEAAALEAEYIVTHMGSHKETTEEEGLQRLSEALNIILDKTKDSQVNILLENTTGSGSWLGYTFIHQQMVLEKIRLKERIGFCLDTAHAYLAGYDLAGEEGLTDLLDEIEGTVKLSRLKLLHLNDAVGKLGSHHDRHDHIGKGGIGLAGMKRIINHPKLAQIPLILETPKSSEDADKKNLALVRKLRRVE